MTKEERMYSKLKNLQRLYYRSLNMADKYEEKIQKLTKRIKAMEEAQ